jgi:hypothetical protein
MRGAWGAACRERSVAARRERSVAARRERSVAVAPAEGNLPTGSSEPAAGWDVGTSPRRNFHRKIYST